VESIYRWQGKVEDALETLVFFKTTTASYSKLQERLCALHPYEVPEIICLSIVQGLPAYLRWINESTHGSGH
jgi:periplasmic divalent cation tolerance protein